jgi:antitoxin component YwqK of YwqJK toxin-antitoxin module
LEDDTVSKRSQYKEGTKHGEIKKYHNNGHIKQDEVYFEG